MPQLVLPSNLELAYLLHIQSGGRTTGALNQEFPSQKEESVRATLRTLKNKGYIWNEHKYTKGIRGRDHSRWWLTGMGEEMVQFIKKWVEVK